MMRRETSIYAGLLVLSLIMSNQVSIARCGDIVWFETFYQLDDLGASEALIARKAQKEINNRFSISGNLTVNIYLSYYGEGAEDELGGFVNKNNQYGFSITRKFLESFQEKQNLRGEPFHTMFSLSDGSEEWRIDDTILRMCPTYKSRAYMMSKQLISDEIDALIIIAEDSEGSEEMRRYMMTYFGGTILETITVPKGQGDFSYYLQRAEDKIQSSMTGNTLENIGVFYHYSDVDPNLVEDASEYFFLSSTRWYVMDFNAFSESLTSNAPEESKKMRMRFVSPVYQENEATEWVKENMGDEEDPFSFINACAYDAYWLLAETILQVESKHRYNVTPKIADVARSYVGITGSCRFDKYGDRNDVTYQIYDLKNGVLTPVGGEFKGKTPTNENPIKLPFDGPIQVELDIEISPAYYLNQSVLWVNVTSNPPAVNQKTMLSITDPDGIELRYNITTDQFGVGGTDWTPSEIGLHVITYTLPESNRYDSATHMAVFNVLEEYVPDYSAHTIPQEETQPETNQTETLPPILNETKPLPSNITTPEIIENSINSTDSNTTYQEPSYEDESIDPLDKWLDFIYQIIEKIASLFKR